MREALGVGGEKPDAGVVDDVNELVLAVEHIDGNGDGAETTIGVELSEFAVTPSESSAPEGIVTFSVSNVGDQAHNFWAIATDAAADELTVLDDTFTVDLSEIAVVVSSVPPDIEAGESQDVSADLAAGNYVLICNVPTHYEAGMNVAFTVE